MSSVTRSSGLSARDRKSMLHLFSIKMTEMTLKIDQVMAMAQFLLVVCSNHVSRIVSEILIVEYRYSRV